MLLTPRLPVASALPVAITAVPSEPLLAAPALLASPPGTEAFCSSPALFVDWLPVAVLCPLVATARPEFVIDPLCSNTRIPPDRSVPDWDNVLSDTDPTAVALPV